MAKTISLTYEGTDYTLEYTRESIRVMESRGFRLADIESKPMTTLPVLFRGAFLAHHRSVKNDVVDKIFSMLGNKEQLVLKLAEMYTEPVDSLLEDPSDGKNLEWGASW